MLNLSHKNLDVYKLTKKYPKEELFALTNQLRRASVPVCTNLAEGAARISSKEKGRFYEIARASVVEIDTQMEISLMLNYIQKKDIIELEKYEESVFKMLSKMISNLRTNTYLPKTTSN